MKLLLSIIFTILLLQGYSQEHTPFSWNSNNVIFESVEMNLTEVKGTVRNTVFKGYKDSKITIKSIGGYTHNVDLQLSGYLAFDAHVNKLVYQKDLSSATIFYHLTDFTDWSVVLAIQLDEVDIKPKNIAVVAENYKTKKKLEFLLTGITVKENDD